MYYFQSTFIHRHGWVDHRVRQYQLQSLFVSMSKSGNTSPGDAHSETARDMRKTLCKYRCWYLTFFSGSGDSVLPVARLFWSDCSQFYHEHNTPVLLQESHWVWWCRWYNPGNFLGCPWFRCLELYQGAGMAYGSCSYRSRGLPRSTVPSGSMSCCDWAGPVQHLQVCHPVLPLKNIET